jgi:hypothetical protein
MAANPPHPPAAAYKRVPLLYRPKPTLNPAHDNELSFVAVLVPSSFIAAGLALVRVDLLYIHGRSFVMFNVASYFLSSHS